MQTQITPVDVFGFGHICIDYINVLDPYPERGRKGTVVESLVVGGGPVPNASAALAMWGASTRFCGRVGAGWEGNLVIRRLMDRGVDCRWIEVDLESETARAHIWIDKKDGARTVALDLSRYRWMTADSLDERLCSACRVFLSDGRMADATIKGLATARANGITTVFDVGTPRGRLDEMFPLVDYALISNELARTYAPGATPMQFAEWIVRQGAKVGVVTAGETGTYWTDGTDSGFCPAFKVTPIIDTTGAGDIFHAGFIWGLLKGWAMDRSLRFASAAGGLACCKLSGLLAIPSLVEVESLVESK